MNSVAPRKSLKGRGAVTNRSGQFEPTTAHGFDDGWDGVDEAPPLRTTVTADHSRTVIARNKSPDVPFDRSINPYRGCEHGCAYCFARPSHAFLGLSPGQDFETRLFFKPEAAALLRAELARPGYRCQPIAMGTNTDPYQPIERTHRVTRSILEVLSAHNHPVTITTKSASVTRDVDILADMARRDLVKVALSVTTLDRRLANRLEPRASTPERRLGAIRALNDAGVPVAVMVAPIIPGLTDTEIESILAAAAQAGARESGYILLRLPLEVASLFREWLEVHAPLKAQRVMSLVRQTQGGKDYDSRFGVRRRGSGPYAELIRQRFTGAARRHRLAARPAQLDLSRFRVPSGQGELF